VPISEYSRSGVASRQVRFVPHLHAGSTVSVRLSADIVSTDIGFSSLMATLTATRAGASNGGVHSRRRGSGVVAPGLVDLASSTFDVVDLDVVHLRKRRAGTNDSENARNRRGRVGRPPACAAARRGSPRPVAAWYTSVVPPGRPHDAATSSGSGPAEPPPRSLDRIALEMTSVLELDAVLASITRGLVDDFGVALARVWLLEPGERTLHLRASSGLSSRLDGAYARVAVGARKIGQIADSGQPVWTNDVEHDDRIADPAWAREHRLVSFAGWPLTFHGSLEGVLATFSRQPLTEAQRPRMALFAHQAAIAIKNARLFAAIHALEDRLRAENAYLRREVAGGEDDAFATLSRCEGLAGVLAQVRQVATTATTVLVQGETGTGKELIARAVHELSPRRSAPIVKVNCAALSPTLVESELFGHEKGAFTGAGQQRIGRFEFADGGTLLLDEVGEVPPELQPKLLRVLQEQEFERVGGTRPVRVDVRIVSATNRDLRQAVDEGRFRADLFYRLAVFPIDVPPLRARPADVEVLAEAFIRTQAQRLGKPLSGLTGGALDRLRGYGWPGNVRELANVLERAAIVASGDAVSEADLPPLARSAARDAGGTPAPPADTASADATLERVERDHIARILERTGWVIEGKKGAAAILGVAPSTLRSRMANLGIRRAPR
jgi:transcriptional regulator with GAF, ATPase, and Fis domain